MPRGDRTGPRGMGSMTGRGAGLCAGHHMPGYANPGPGNGFGKGYKHGRGLWGQGFGGGGRGWRHWFQATGLPGWMRFGGDPARQTGTTPEDEKQALQSRANALQAEIDRIHQRLSELEPRPQGE